MSKFHIILLYIAIIRGSSHPIEQSRDVKFLPAAEFLAVESEIKRGNCSNCPIGWGVSKLCTAITPTECKKCIAGVTYGSQFSNIRYCWPCSKCGIGLYEAHRCSPRRDTICDDCLNVIYKPKISNNEDFHVKCGYLFVRKTKFESEKYEEKTVLNKY